MLHSVNNLFSPRIGIAWDPTGHGDWAVRGGFGIYNNWLTQANVQEEFRGSPPGEVSPTFFAGGTASAQAPIFVLGTGSKPPFGFTFPTFGTGTGPTPQSGGGLNAQGGVVGASFAIGGINPLLKSPKADIWSLSVERKISKVFAATVGYNGSHSYNIVGNGNSIGNVSYGVDINTFAGDLITNESIAPTRLNHSFGAITYADNNRYGNYEAVFFDFKAKLSRGYIDASYTRARSKDDGLAYPTADQSAAVLWAVHFRCAQSVLTQLQLFAQRFEWRQRSGWCSHRWMGNQRNEHLPVRISSDGLELQRL